MHVHSLALVLFSTSLVSAANAHLLRQPECPGTVTVTVTVTSPQTVHKVHEDSTRRSSSSALPCTSSVPSSGQTYPVNGGSSPVPYSQQTYRANGRSSSVAYSQQTYPVNGRSSSVPYSQQTYPANGRSSSVPSSRQTYPVNGRSSSAPSTMQTYPVNGKSSTKSLSTASIKKSTTCSEKGSSTGQISIRPYSASSPGSTNRPDSSTGQAIINTAKSSPSSTQGTASVASSSSSSGSTRQTVSVASSTLSSVSTSQTASVGASSQSSSSSTGPTSSVGASSQSSSSSTGPTSSVASSQSSSSSSSSAAAPSASSFLIRGTSPGQPAANGQYAVVSTDGFLQFTAANPANASQFTLSTSGQLLFNLRPASINPALPAAEIQFAAGTTKVKAKRQSGTAAVTCIVGADTNGAAILQCAADVSTIQQACGTGFYLGPTLQCQAITLTQVFPNSAAATTNPPAGTSANNPFPGTPFSLQANGPPVSATYQGGYAAYFQNPSGVIELAFANYFHGAAFYLDTNGHLLGDAPCPPNAAGCTGNVAYAATFQVGSTSGPVSMQYGEITAGYAPIICQTLPVAGQTYYTLSCMDGANGVNNLVQQCASDILYLGATLGAGCSASTFLVTYQTS